VERIIQLPTHHKSYTNTLATGRKKDNEMAIEIQKLPSDLISDIKTRLKTLSGQINGIVKMLDEGKDPEQINIQFKSIDKGIQKAHYVLLDEVYRKALAIGIVKAVDSCPGNCGNEEKIEYLKKEFPNLELSDLTEKLKEIQTIENRLKDYNNKKV
jgi:DNA-binding FrmR family transcriptional regulator